MVWTPVQIRTHPFPLPSDGCSATNRSGSTNNPSPVTFKDDRAPGPVTSSHQENKKLNWLRVCNEGKTLHLLSSYQAANLSQACGMQGLSRYPAPYPVVRVPRSSAPSSPPPPAPAPYLVCCVLRGLEARAAAAETANRPAREH